MWQLKRNGFPVAVHQDQEPVVGDDLAPLVDLQHHLAIEQHSHGTDIAGLPFLVRHVVSAGIDPADIADFLPVNAPALKISPPVHNGMFFPQGNQKTNRVK